MTDPPPSADRPPPSTILSTTQLRPEDSANQTKLSESNQGGRTPDRCTVPDTGAQSADQRHPFPQGTPRTAKPSTHRTHHKDPTYKKKINREMDGKLCQEPFSKLLGEIPGRNMSKANVRKLGNLFTGLDTVLESSDTNSDKEKKMYPIICNGFSAIVTLAKSSDVFKDVADHPEKTSHDMRPDLALYQTAEEAVSAYTLDDIDQVKPKERQEHIARTAWPWMVTFVEVKVDEVDSGFHFRDKTQFLRISRPGFKARAQVATYATELMLRQHRTHLYSLYIAGRWLRFTRWDRSGAVVSSAVNMVEDPTCVYNLIYRFVRLERWQQEYDPSIKLASATDIDKLSMYEPTNVNFKAYRDFMLNNQAHFPLYKVECEVFQQQKERLTGRRTRSATKKTTKVYLIGRHISGHYSPTGRATRGYCAFDLEESALRFFKDMWRPNVAGTHPEWDTYRRLKDHGVNCVATAIAGGDVHGRNQTTFNHEYLNKRSGTAKLVERVHARIVLKELGRPLEDYADQVELITVCAHALIGHQQAWQKAGVLHRDISVGNIMIDIETGRGFLNDWDLCKYKEDFDKYVVPTQPAGISGTWPFMSAVTLLCPRKPHEVSDDLESFVYVLVYCAFRYHRHQHSPQAPRDISKEEQLKLNAANRAFAVYVNRFFYDDSTQSDGHYAGGDTKQKEIKLGEPPVRLINTAAGHSPLARLLEDLYVLLQTHYQVIERSKVLQRYGSPSTEVVPAGPARSEKTPHFVDPFALVNEVPKDMPAPVRRKSPARPLPSGSAEAYDTPPLANHDLICSLFANAFKDDEKQLIDLSNFQNDRFFDQFEDLQVATEERMKGTTTNTTQTTVSGTKRSSPSDLLSPTLKKVRAYGNYFNLASYRQRTASGSAAESASAVVRAS